MPKNPEYLFLDTETTGVDDKDRLVQVAYKTSDDDHHLNSLYKAEIPISYMAMAVNHITNDMIKDAATFKNSSDAQTLQTLLEDGYILVAHNAPFDIRMLAAEGITTPRFICTKKLVTWLDRDAVLESYKLQYLRYRLNVNVEAIAHDAYGDILVLEQIFAYIVNAMKSIYMGQSPADLADKMMHISANPILLKIMPYGKHKGMPFETVPKSYLKWLLKDGKHSEDVIFSAKHYFLKTLAKP